MTKACNSDPMNSIQGLRYGRGRSHCSGGRVDFAGEVEYFPNQNVLMMHKICLLFFLSRNLNGIAMVLSRV